MQLQENQVRIEMDYASLNFKDLMVAMGQLKDISTILFEGAGTDSEVGNVAKSQFSAGDAVYVFHPDGVATTSVVDTGFVRPIPKGMDIQTAAATPVAYATALYSLRDVARLQPGDSVLIFIAVPEALDKPPSLWHNYLTPATFLSQWEAPANPVSFENDSVFPKVISFHHARPTSASSCCRSNPAVSIFC